MKIVLLIVVSLIVMINANPLSRSCDCKAVSNTVHFPFHSWEVTSCKFCSCADKSMKQCEESCKTIVQVYANTGCGKAPKGTIVKYSWQASTCSTGISTDEFTCA